MDRERFEWILEGLDDDKLTVWEAEFLESVAAFFENRGYLTEKQEEILERIYREKSR